MNPAITAFLDGLCSAGVNKLAMITAPPTACIIGSSFLNTATAPKAVKKYFCIWKLSTSRP